MSHDDERIAVRCITLQCEVTGRDTWAGVSLNNGYVFVVWSLHLSLHFSLHQKDLTVWKFSEYSRMYDYISIDSLLTLSLPIP